MRRGERRALLLGAGEGRIVSAKKACLAHERSDFYTIFAKADPWPILADPAKRGRGG